MVPQLSYLTLTLITVAVYFMWMDVALYINLQQVLPVKPDVKPIVVIPGNASSDDYSFSPFYPLTVKLLFMGPTIHYVDDPLSFWTVRYTNVAAVFSANVVSIAGVVVAAVAAKMFLSESLRVRQFGVLLFKVRDYLDSLDGSVARERMHEVKMNPIPGTFGYYFDGICDGLADLMLYLTLFLYLCRVCGNKSSTTNNGFGYSRLDSKPDLLPVKVADLRSGSFWRRALPVIILVAVVAGQTILSTVMWNVNMVKFHKLLETDTYATSVEQFQVQNEALKSSSMWIIIYFWRIFNPHSLNQFILLSILYNKTFEYFHTVKYWGYLPILVVSLMSFIYSKVALAKILAAGIETQ